MIMIAVGARSPQVLSALEAAPVTHPPHAHRGRIGEFLFIVIRPPPAARADNNSHELQLTFQGRFSRRELILICADRGRGARR